jgi:hypothetical protein
MSQGARNWPFLTLIAAPVSPAASRQVGLAAQEGGDLQDVAGLRPRCALLGRVDVGQHRAADAGLDLRQDIEPAAMPTPRLPERLVRLALS